MQHHDKCNGISHGSRTGRFFWKLLERNFREDGPGRDGPPTTANTGDNGQYRGKQNIQRNWKIKISRAIDMRYYWVRDRIRQNHFRIFWVEGKKNLSAYVTKHHPIWHHRAMRPRSIKATTKKDMENSKDRRTGTGRGCAGTTNPGVTQKPYNPLNVIRKPIPWNPDNPLKGIQDLVKNRTRIQCPIGLTISN